MIDFSLRIMDANTSESAAEQAVHAVLAANPHVANNLRRAYVSLETTAKEYVEPAYPVAVRLFGATTEVSNAAAIAHESRRWDGSSSSVQCSLPCISQCNNLMTSMNQRLTATYELYSTISKCYNMTNSASNFS